ncbi:hypothetical protein pb186bvf_004845 [Paramecium bursaria]
MNLGILLNQLTLPIKASLTKNKQLKLFKEYTQSDFVKKSQCRNLRAKLQQTRPKDEKYILKCSEYQQEIKHRKDFILLQ